MNRLRTLPLLIATAITLLAAAGTASASGRDDDNRGAAAVPTNATFSGTLDKAGRTRTFTRTDDDCDDSARLAQSGNSGSGSGSESDDDDADDRSGRRGGDDRAEDDDRAGDDAKPEDDHRAGDDAARDDRRADDDDDDDDGDDANCTPRKVTVTAVKGAIYTGIVTGTLAGDELAADEATFRLVLSSKTVDGAGRAAGRLVVTTATGVLRLRLDGRIADGVLTGRLKSDKGKGSFAGFRAKRLRLSAGTIGATTIAFTAAGSGARRADRRGERRGRRGDDDR